MAGDAIVPPVDRFAALLAVQDADTEIGQLRYALDHHELLESVRSGEAVRAALAEELAAVQRRRIPVAEEQERLEREIDQASTKITRLDASLYDGSIVGHKELEAVQHEIAFLKSRVSQFEDADLEQMELAEPIDAEFDALGARVQAAETGIATAAAAWEPKREEIAAHLAEMVTRRDVDAAVVPDDLLKLYEGLRRKLGGIGAARLENGRCMGCHLAIPAGELIELRALPDDAVVHCPECNRILVR